MPAHQPQLVLESSHGDQAPGLERAAKDQEEQPFMASCWLVPCFREIFQAGPSRDRSTSIWLSLVALPRVIWGNGVGEGWHLRTRGRVCIGQGKMRNQAPDIEQ